MKLIYILLGAISLASAKHKTYEVSRVLRVDVENQEQLKALSSLRDEYDFWTDERIGWVDVMDTPNQDLEKFLKLSEINFTIQIPDVQRLIQQERIVQMRKVGSPTNGSKALTWNNYNRLDEIYVWIDEMVGRYPNVATAENIGVSTEGRNLKLIKIGAPATNKPAIWIDAGIHAREWITPAIATWMINELLTKPENQNILDSVDFYILPVANPDGYEQSCSCDYHRL